MSCSKSIMIVGVGGQGSLLATRLLGNVLTSLNYDVKASEVHGMSQRGGSVVTYLKYGSKVYSPLIDKGEADYIVAFERLEAARWLSWLRTGGKMIVNDRRVSPMPVITGAMQYPDDIVTKLRESGADIVALDALELAVRAGSSKAVNIVLMGVLSVLTDIPENVWAAALRETIPGKFLELNESAFQLGRQALE